MKYSFIRKNINSFSILLFLVLFTLINIIKPSFIYNKDGSLREFGLGRKKRTIIPLWLMSIILGILSYLFVLYYITLPKLY
jgi:hypothetical protein